MNEQNNKQYVVGLGEALWDVLPEGKKLGGAPANFAFHAGQFGLDALAVSAVGDDNLGKETLKEFEIKHLHYLMPKVPYATGTVQVTVDDQGIPTYDIKENVAWDNIPFTPEIEDVARHCRAVCWGSLAQRNVVSRTTIRKFLQAMPRDGRRLRIFDINLRQSFYTPEVIQESLEQCNILKINDEELVTVSRLFGYPGLDIRNKCWLILGKYNLDMLVLTCGVNGSYVFSPGKVSFQPTPKVKVADTVGAGDSFTGSFCAAILEGRSIEEAHELAVKVSAYVCTQKGAMPKLPTEFTSL
jgi:fructokinase